MKGIEGFCCGNASVGSSVLTFRCYEASYDEPNLIYIQSKHLGGAAMEQNPIIGLITHFIIMCVHCLTHIKVLIY
jgi:hypothetical protein